MSVNLHFWIVQVIYSNLGGLGANKNSPDFVLCKALLFFCFCGANFISQSVFG